MLLVSEEVASKVVNVGEAIVMMERVFAEQYRGEAEVLPVVMGRGPEEGSLFSIKSGTIGPRELVGLKVGSYWPGNRKQGRPAHASTTFLLDPATGLPRALIAASYLTCIRTAASDGVGIKHLSRADSSSLAMIGAGHQAWFELLAACEVRPIRTVRVWNRSEIQAEAFAAKVRRELGLEAYACSIEDAVRLADIVITITASRQPLVKRAWVRPGTHISTMGADASGKIELDPDLVAAARLFADVVQQSITLGDFEAAFKAGKIDQNAIRPIGAVIEGQSGRRFDSDITIYDSSGMALQDLAIGELALDNAIRRGLASTPAFLADEMEVAA